MFQRADTSPHVLVDYRENHFIVFSNNGRWWMKDVREHEPFLIEGVIHRDNSKRAFDINEAKDMRVIVNIHGNKVLTEPINYVADIGTPFQVLESTSQKFAMGAIPTSDDAEYLLEVRGNQSKMRLFLRIGVYDHHWWFIDPSGRHIPISGAYDKDKNLVQVRDPNEFEGKHIGIQVNREITLTSQILDVIKASSLSEHRNLQFREPVAFSKVFHFRPAT
jgi:hypothetical protein